jgi:hypothetical protein
MVKSVISVVMLAGLVIVVSCTVSVAMRVCSLAWCLLWPRSRRRSGHGSASGLTG